MAQPAASRLLAEMEALLGLTLHERQGRGLAADRMWARRWRGARLGSRSSLSDAAREVAEAATGRAGVVRVGCCDRPRAQPGAADTDRRCSASLPDFRAEVTVGTSINLCDQLRDGRLDFALARLAVGRDAAGGADVIAGEPLSLVVRRGHPLLVRPKITVDDLLQYDWVMGDDETLLTQTVMARLAELRHARPEAADLDLVLPVHAGASEPDRCHRPAGDAGGRQPCRTTRRCPSCRCRSTLA